MYTIRKTDCGSSLSADSLAAAFGIPEGLEAAEIRHYSWAPGGYCPVSRAYAGWDREGLRLWLFSVEEEIRAEVTEHGGPVWTDSCLEFFVSAGTQANLPYLNCECSPFPCVHLGLGPKRDQRRVFTEPPEGMDLSSLRVPNLGWCVHYTLPAAFLKQQLGIVLHSGLRLRGNFYKCGDLTPCPHYGMWSPVDTRLYPQPDFHRPEYFADMILE